MGGRRYEIVTGSPWVIPGELPTVNVFVVSQKAFQIKLPWLWLDLLATAEVFTGDYRSLATDKPKKSKTTYSLLSVLFS